VVRLSSDEICNEYAAQKMLCQIQAFTTEKKQILSGFFHFQKKSALKKAKISKFGFKIAKLPTLVWTTENRENQ